MANHIIVIMQCNSIFPMKSFTASTKLLTHDTDPSQYKYTLIRLRCFMYVLDKLRANSLAAKVTLSHENIFNDSKVHKLELIRLNVSD
ncbi:hypothetical protein EB796_001045 [Bugula neritina]|uniref:Uncharacterized protein n=1 Tax=Bugula neritina TaxID=10212 RepID=A0A7J7KR37_BUGNE|nr:hypothetical protein EB796_001045 [Bugula neritina]